MVNIELQDSLAPFLDDFLESLSRFVDGEACSVEYQTGFDDDFFYLVIKKA
jgi:hypothetical protein